jgi:hypothetical protein
VTASKAASSSARKGSGGGESRAWRGKLGDAGGVEGNPGGDGEAGFIVKAKQVHLQDEQLKSNH